jgi:hypothetical protein
VCDQVRKMKQGRLEIKRGFASSTVSILTSTFVW